MEIKKSGEIIALPVSGKTNARALKTAAVAYLQKGDIVHLDCIGVVANYIATKAIILMQGCLSTRGQKCRFAPFYHDYTIEDSTDGSNVKTGIRWVLELNI